MNIRTLLTSLISLVFSLCLAQQHRALLVGVAHYPSSSGWREVHSDNDVALLNGILKKSYSVRTIVDKQATYKNIQKELSNLASSTHAGDTVLISFSCHGQQMISDDEKEQDGLDEALIPYDAQVKYSSSYKGENHLRDNNLSNWVSKIRKKAGHKGFVLVLLDACHSGDSYRGNAPISYRGGYPVFGQDSTRRNTEKELKKSVKIDESDNMSDVLYIGACQSYQRDDEIKIAGKWYGPLSYAFYETYKTEGLGNVNLLGQNLYDRISSHLKKSGQCPEFATNIDSFKIENRASKLQNSDNSREDDGFHINIPDGGYILGLVLLLIVCIFVWKKK